MKARIEEFSRKNQDLQQDLTDIRDKFQAAEETREHMKRNFTEKERECKELHKSIARLSMTCSDQHKTIEGLRQGLDESGGISQTPITVDEQVSKMRMELSDAMAMLNDATELCTKFLEFVKSRHGKHELKNQGIEAIQFSLDGQCIVEALQGMKRKAENLSMSFQTMSKLLQEKANAFSSKSQRRDVSPDDGSQWLPSQTSVDALESELKAESLMTRLLREKLHSKELEVEQLHADLATAVRTADCVKSEVQNALDSLSSITDNLKELEMQMRKKDEKIGQLDIEVDESIRELSMMKKIDYLDEIVHEKEGQISILTNLLCNKPANLLDSPDFPHGLVLP
ncbi:hypothetical protein MLD38_024187 [Melastoma candidum]|uniref:Uncharacterized protein n=1 Tax=Melastoma candidum TaxID=119954 RepID=A0ACB9NSJ2_9MYRT|nr:hypothetical protein MLD38_024187 [Melastoma candidum]